MDLKKAWDPYFSPGYELEVKASTRRGKMSRDSPRLLVYARLRVVLVNLFGPYHPAALAMRDVNMKIMER